MWAFVLGACAPSSKEPNGTGEPPDTATHDTALTCPVEVQPGTGVDRFEPLGSELELVHGPQGGWHLVAAARWCGLPEPVTVAVVATWVATGEVVGQTAPFAKTPVPDGACCFQVSDLWTYLLLDDGALAGPTLHGEALSLELTVVDGDDVAHEVSAVVTAIDPESL
jgi:hypothetical protein